MNLRVHWCDRSRWLIGALLVLGVPALSSAQIVTENAGITSPAVPILRESLSYDESENVRSLLWSHQFLYGITPQLEASLEIPIVLDRRIRFDSSPGNGHRATLSGVGDLSFEVKRSIFQSDEILESTRWALFARGSLPTGGHDERADGVAVPRPLALGTGSFGFGAGSAFTIIRDRHRVSLEAAYSHWTRHDGFRPGPEVDLNLAYWLRLHPASYEPDRPTVEIRPVLELLSTHRFASQGAVGSLDDDGTNVYLAPGLQLYPEDDLLFELGVQLPIVQGIDDERGDRHWSVTLAVKFLF